MSALPDTDALAKLLAEATPGPWFKHGNGQQIMSKTRLIATMPYGAQSKPDSRLIAIAPALAAQRIAAAARIAELEAALREARESLEGEPEYHPQGLGCGLEDRGITDRYDAMEHGWERAMERVYGEQIKWAREVIDAALEPRP